MAEGTYEHACMRAELLGLEKPNKDDFLRNNPQIANSAEDEDIAAAQFVDISLQNEDLKQVSGGISELNSILAGTQKKINKIKNMYGSLTDILKNKISGSKDNISYSTDPSYLPPDGSGPSSTGADINEALNNLEMMKANQEGGNNSGSIGRDVNQQVSTQINKLDSLLDQTDRALCSMEQQNKQMKKFVKK